MPISNIVRRLWYLLRRDRMLADLEDEMRLHVELRAEQIAHAQGMAPNDAYRAARQRFGNVASLVERGRDAWGLGGLERFWLDVRHAARRLHTRPALALPIVIILALGTGATTAVFSALDAALLRPLPFAEPRRLVALPQVQVPFQAAETSDPTSQPPTLTTVSARPELFSSAAAYAAGGLNLSDPDHPLRLKVGVVTSTFFATLGVRPLLGRTFTLDEGRPNGSPAVVLSHALWQRQFGGREMLGTRIALNGKRYTVVGVMPPGFSFPNESDLWLAMPVPVTFAIFDAFRGYMPSQVIGRLAPGVTTDRAQAQMLAWWEHWIGTAKPDLRDQMRGMVDELRSSGAAIPLQRFLVGSRDAALLMLMGATAFLLLIGCANVANLLLSDGAVRRRELAVREVLGANRARLVRQLLLECLLLALAGAALGLVLAPALLGLLRVLLPNELAGVAPARIDDRVLTFSLALSVTTAIAFGIWPALSSTRGDAGPIIKSGGIQIASARATAHARRALIAAELALTVMLLVGAGLMLRTFERIMAQTSGIDTAHVGSLELSFAMSMQPAERRRIIDGMLARLAATPGVESAAAVSDLPLARSGGISLMIHTDVSASTKEAPRFARYLMASGGYFETMGIPLLRGRTFTSADDSLGPHVVIVNETMARSFWPGMDALGHSVELGGTPGAPSQAYTVAGIVGDVREGGLEAEPTPQMYFSIYEQTPSNLAIVARGGLPGEVLLTRLTDALRVVSPGQPGFDVRTMDAVLHRSIAPRRTNTVLIVLFAALALLLSGLGVYAVVSYAVAQRSRELGIRAALGATRKDLLWLVSRETVPVILYGTLTGVIGAWTFSRVVASLLYGVQAHDSVTFATVPLVLLIPVGLSMLVPGLRASRASPVEVMRTE